MHLKRLFCFAPHTVGSTSWIYACFNILLFQCFPKIRRLVVIWDAPSLPGHLNRLPEKNKDISFTRLATIKDADQYAAFWFLFLLSLPLRSNTFGHRCFLLNMNFIFSYLLNISFQYYNHIFFYSIVTVITNTAVMITAITLLQLLLFSYYHSYYHYICYKTI